MASRLHQRVRVSDKRARLYVVSEWLMEFSVLISVIALIGGILLRRE